MKIVSLEDAIRSYIFDVLEITNWQVKGPGGAAELLGLSSSTLYSKMKKLGIKRKTVPNKRSRSNKQQTSQPPRVLKLHRVPYNILGDKVTAVTQHIDA